MTKKELKELEQAILAEAKEKGLHNNYFLVTTLDRYRFQLRILAELEKEIKKSGPMVTKEYVKGRKNVYTSPAIAEYNKTVSSANGTASTLMSFLRQPAPTTGGGPSKLQELMEAYGE